MLFAVFAKLFSVLLDLLGLLAQSERENTLEIVLLRQQLRILQRTQPRAPALYGTTGSPVPQPSAHHQRHVVDRENRGCAGYFPHPAAKEQDYNDRRERPR